MKYVQEPKPVEYDPLTISALELKQEMGPVDFKVATGTHAKSLVLLNAATPADPVCLPTLLPSEMWGFARVVSNYFGRLNEVAVSRTKWQIKGYAFPGDILRAYSKIVKTERRKQLPFALIETNTVDSNGRTLLTSLDELLLLHEAPANFYREREIVDEGPFEFEVPRRVYYRYDWNPAIWKNNIHTDEYARRFGYEKGLPEFITYMDALFDIVFRQVEAVAYSAIITVPFILPVYLGDDIILRAGKGENGFDVRFVKKNMLRLKAKVSI